MASNSYMGIPREKIPWYPAVDENACTKCSTCLDFCANDVFEQGEGSVEVVRPYNCVVGCSSCQNVCPSGAIRFPDMRQFVETLKKLREEYRNK
ncbi:MAG: ferredoxin family protein [Candidatus Marinimicrobia bacterium]|nr:ferredoxin family protein [Candidatus Neomarinimicrobiota bacterium]